MGTVRTALLAAVLYLAAARYAVLLQDVAGLGAVFWPGAGVTLTALLVSPRRSWPAILAAVGAAELGNDLVAGFGPVPSLWWAAANMLEPLLAAWLIQRWRADTFADVRGLTAFVAAVVLAPLLGAAIGAIGTTRAVSELPYLVTFGQWVIGDGLGMLTVVPFGLLVLGRIPAAGLRSAEAMIAVVVLVATSALVFSAGDASPTVPGAYLVLLPMLWMAVRLRMAGSALSLFVVSQVANGFHAVDRGPFSAATSAVEASAQLQLFLAAVGVAVLLLACRTVESENFQDLAETREQLIAAVSHELRSPLTPIIGFSETLLRRDDIDARARQAVEVIHRNGQHLTVLVEDLLRASRARRGILPVQPEEIALDDFVDRLVIGRSEMDVEVSLEADVRTWVDPTHLTQILTNLLDNAKRHGRPPVRLSASAQGDRVEVAVSDQGGGVPDWFVPELFEEFAQVSRADTRGGLGLGLPIARTLAVANHGDLRYERGLEGGARFVLVLPSTQREAGRAPARKASATAVKR
ncbi:MAG: MASE1 domain-containing protein [Nitriliruptoraceae bacterium]